MIRPERPGDAPGIRAVVDEAFGGPDEGRLIEALRASEFWVPSLSLVAEEGGRIVGHVLFSRITVGGAPALALAPMAVAPSLQRQGVGSALVRRGLGEAKALGERLVIVLGHPAYYPRFGFVTAKPLGITCRFSSPDDAFMALDLRPEAGPLLRGEAVYPDPWDAF